MGVGGMSMSHLSVSESNHIELLHGGRHREPHGFLGLHALAQGEKVIRIFAPKQTAVALEYKGEKVEASASSIPGLFTFRVPRETSKLDYRIYYPNGVLAHDPYAFEPTFSIQDGQLFSQGIHYSLYEALGSHVVEHMGVKGTKFAVWAPNAQRVSIVGDFNNWKEFSYPMRKLSDQGIWELFLPGIDVDTTYKYAIRTSSGESFLKSDPFSHQYEVRPRDASVVSSSTEFCWRDAEWIDRRTRENVLDGPMNIYEVHLGSWVKKGKQFLNYRELASELVPYLKEMGYTHLELLPVTEHPLDESWGYQVTGFFAPTSRFGDLSDFQYFVNHLHMHGIGVILDWSPGHFPKDDFSLMNFDGDCLFEKEDTLMKIHPEWGTCIFDFSKSEVKNFLLSSALFWIEKLHIDAIRVDAVQSMLFLDYARQSDEWRPNKDGGNEDLDAINFLKHLNSVVHERCPGVVMIAEDASVFPDMTKPVEWGGLGFDLKWNLGWMNDTLSFMGRDPIHRKYHMDELLLSYNQIENERYIMPISHDEVVHEKKSLISKMPLEEWDQFAQARLYYASAICHPGKSLFFMGTELGQKREWDCKGEIHWHLLTDHMHIKMKKFIRAINHFYLSHPALWEIDFDQKGFDWIDHNDYNHSVISFVRNGVQEKLVCVHNYTRATFEKYTIRLPKVARVKELINSDDEQFGGSGMTNTSISVLDDKSGFDIRMPPLACMIFEVTFEDGRF